MDERMLVVAVKQGDIAKVVEKDPGLSEVVKTELDHINTLLFKFLGENKMIQDNLADPFGSIFLDIFVCPEVKEIIELIHA